MSPQPAPPGGPAGGPRPVARVVCPAAIVVLAAAGLPAAQAPSRFTLGDHSTHVRQVQGTPAVIERLASLGLEIWSYEGSTVTFEAATGRVIAWNDPAGRLRVRLRWTRATPDSVLRLGAALTEVARLHGTPWAITTTEAGREMFLAYGRSVIRVAGDDRTVTGWIRRDRALRVDPAQDSVAVLSMVPRLGTGDRSTGPRPRRFDEAPAGHAPLPVVVADVRLADTDGDGRLAPGEFGDLTIVLRNLSSASLPTLHGVVRLAGLQVLSTPADSFALGSLAPGAAADLALAVAATTASDLGLEIALTDRRGTSVRFALDIRSTARRGRRPRDTPVSSPFPRRSSYGTNVTPSPPITKP